MLARLNKTQSLLFSTFLSLCIIYWNSFHAIIVHAETSKLILSEIQCANGDNKFIELYNTSNECIPAEETKKYQLKKITATGNSSDSIAVFPSIDIAKGSHLLWVKNDDSLYFSLADFHTSETIADNTSIGLFYNGSQIDSIVCGKEKDKFSNMLSPFLQNIQKGESIIRDKNTLTWSISTHPSPEKRIGAICEKVITPPSIPSTHDIRINELLPNPTGSDTTKEWIELFNFGTAPINLKNWSFTKKSGSPIPIPEEEITSNGFRVIPIGLINSSETISLLDPSGTIISVVSYEHAPSGNSLNFFKQGIYRWSDKVTRGKTNEFNNAPETKEKDIPDTTYRDVLTTFSATGKDGDGDSIKYTWDFGDGHKSYKGETTHRYAKEGKYEGTLTVTDGTESVVTHFTIDVEKYEAPKVRMIALVPNPTGRDTATEHITLENRSKKSVDLLGWSIATGWKKLVNHPIRESFVIPKKSNRNITHAFSAFTLPNEKGRIELRSPDGETVQKLKYNLKGKSAEENARLVKEKGKKWEWIIPQLTDNSEQETSLTAVVPPAESAIINLEEEQLQKDTKIITQRKNRGEKLLSSETNAPEEMRRLISYGTDIETPTIILALAPRVAGASDEISPTGQDNTDTGPTININALINHWLARE